MTEYNSQNVDNPNVENQIKYPLDYVSQEVLNQFLRNAYPIGSVYTSVVSTNPNTLFGFGSWTAFATGRTLVGIDTGQTEFDVIEETGGSKTHTLTTAEMPSHTHDIYVGNQGNGSPSIAGSGSTPSSTAGYITSTGGGGSHNNLQPYIVVYYWKRTA